MVTSSRDPERTRQRILRAARREFVAKGFAGARVDAIARAASVNKRMLYHYFGDKEALFRAILREGIATNLDLVAAAPADPADLLPFLAARVLQRVDGIRLLQWEALGHGEGKLIAEDERRKAWVEGSERLRDALLGRSTAAAGARVESLGLYRVALWVLLGANLLAGWGVQWDIQWHVRVGRDSFWIPPHVMTYAGVTIVVLASFGVLARDTLRRLVAGRPPTRTLRILGLSGTRGFHLAACGIALTVLAAPIDDLWHRLFGLDVTLWSPPHLLGLFGVSVNTLACVLIAREAYPAQPWARYAGIVVAASSFYGSLAVALRPSGRLAYLYGGVLVFFLSSAGG